MLQEGLRQSQDLVTYQAAEIKEGKTKRVEIKDAEDLDRPRATSTRSVLTLKPLPKIDPKDKGNKDEEIAELPEDWEAEEEMKKLRKFPYDTIAAQRRFLAQQIIVAIRSRPPTRTQLRNQMMTYLKHVGGKKHVDLKNKNFEEIQVLYKEVKRSDKTLLLLVLLRMRD
ncbi:hypothetical protein Tco_1515934 [Tanacetum coccineum]